MAPIRNQKGKRMWPSLVAANKIADWANVFFIGSLVVGVVSTVLIVWMSGVKEAYWEKDRTESAEHIAALGVQGDQLRKDTAEANARALEAQLALEKFKAPRVLTDPQAVRVGEKLKPFGNEPVDLFLYSESAENIALIGPISYAVNTGGRKTRIWHVFGGSFFGVLVSVQRGAPDNIKRAGEALISALNEEGISTKRQNEFSIEDWPQHTAGPPTPAFADRAPIRVMVGNKPI